MPCTLPPEILDLIVDHLCDEPTALKACCLVSKSLVPRTRKHIFAHVEFHAQKSTIELWKEAFPNPSVSPAHYTRILCIVGLPIATGADTSISDWIRAFDNLVHLHVEMLRRDDPVSLVPLHGLSPVLRSLRLVYTSTASSETLDFVCSFPLLEDLALVSLDHSNRADRLVTPSTSPKLTGSLYLMTMGIRPIARQLCDLSGGLRFSKIMLSCLVEDFEPTTDLISRCSDTLESLSVSFHLPGLSRVSSLDLSKVTKLKDLRLQCGRLGIWWVTMTLQTIKSKKLRRITIHPNNSSFTAPIGETIHQQWLELDRVSVQLCTSFSIRLQIVCERVEEGKDISHHLPRLLPEVTRRGLIDLVDYTAPSRTIQTRR